MYMNTTEMLKEICGVNETGKTKSGVTLDLSLWNVDDDEIETIKLFTLYKPIIQVVRNHEFIQIDFKFISTYDKDFHIFWETIEKYGSLLEEYAAKIDEAEEKGKEIKELPYLGVTIVPAEWDWAFHMAAICPITWALIPEKPGEESLVIRTLFKDENVGFYQVENFNIDKIKAEEDRKVAMLEQSMMQAMIEKEKREAENS